MDDGVWGVSDLAVTFPPGTTLSNVAANGSDLTVVNALVLSLQGDGPMSTCQAVSFCVPVTVPSGELLIGYKNAVTLSVQRSNGARAVVVADLAGITRIYEFDFSPPGESPADVLTQIEIAFSPLGLESLADLGLPNPVPAYQATLLLAVQRKSSQDFVNASLDALDVHAGLVSAPPTT